MEVRGSGGGGCCIARYGHNPNYYSPYNLSKMGRIMLRYRPIAPKPVPGGSPPLGAGSRNDDVKANHGRGKRRSGGTASKSGGNKRRKSRSSDDEGKKSDGEEKCHVVTLPLLPETPVLVSPREDQSRRSSSTWLSFGRLEEDRAAQEVVVTTVIVEGVTDTWLEGNGLGRTDEERRKRLEDDTCPGFISDGWNRVWWTNEAYRRMVINDKRRKEERSSSAAVVVRLGMKEKMEIPSGNLFPAFTCGVRLQYGKQGSNWMTVPCDVWRLDGGGFAWRLDVKTALSLGL